jgi:NAD(P)-dependent dehydrogenase (short-subunit alcohol dehydrogenase family)
MASAETSFAGQLALVTGASHGIGAATALALGAAGAHVILTGRDTKALESIEDIIHNAGGSATIAPLDLNEPDAIARLATAIAGRWSALDIMVLSAAHFPQLTSVADIDQAHFTKTLTTNVLATQALLARFDRLLRASKNGRIIGLTSSVAAAPRAFWGAYGASKAAFEALLDCYAAEVKNLAPLRVAVVNPGATRTAMRAKAYPGEDPASVKPAELVAKRIIALLATDFPTATRMNFTAN